MAPLATQSAPTYRSSAGRSLTVRIVAADGVPAQGSFFATYQAVPALPRSAQSIEQEVVLGELYQATGGDTWKQNFGWQGGCSSCARYGVICDSTGHIHQIWLVSNSLKGTIPASLGKITSITRLGWWSNSLTGTVPPQISNLISIRDIDFSLNSLTGSIPPQLGVLNSVTFLGFNHNSLTGSIPLQIGNFTSLLYLQLHANSLTGTLPPQLGNLNSVTHLALSSNSFTGSIPSQIGNLTSITTLLLYDNSLTGTLPLQLGYLSSLHRCVVSNNRLSGTIDHAALPWNLEILMLHGNRFTGITPSFASHRNLTDLTLFGNQLGGRLVLPTAGSMHNLYVHGNRLSCPVIADRTTVDNKTNLVVPGNSFSNEPALPWMRMGKVDFLFQTTTWNRWRWTIIGLACGSMATLISLAYCWLPETQGWSHASWTGALIKAVAFQPQGEIQHLQIWTAKTLLVWSTVGLVLLWPTFAVGADFYECDEVWLEVTLANLWKSPVAEWVGAVTANLLAAMWAASIRMLEGHSFAQQMGLQGDNHSSITCRQGTLLLVMWLPVTVMLSIPSSFYCFTQSLPPDENMLGIGRNLINISHYTIGIVVFVISGYVVPQLARVVVQWVCPKSSEVAKAQISGKLMMAARLTLVVLSPFLTLLLTNQGCFAKWLVLWSPCADPAAFSPKTYTYAQHLRHWVGTTEFTLPGLITHAEICTPTYVVDGRCPRALIKTLAELYISKLAFSVYLVPLLNLLNASVKGRATKEWVVRTLLRKPDYRASKCLTREVVGVVMMMELPIILGFSVPVVSLLACLGTTLNAFVFHTAVACMGVELTDEIKASSHYLWISLAIGCALPSWVYLESNMHGRWLVAVGMPMSAACGAFAGTKIMQQSAREVQRPSLREPLIDSGDLSNQRDAESDSACVKDGNLEMQQFTHGDQQGSHVF